MEVKLKEPKPIWYDTIRLAKSMRSVFCRHLSASYENFTADWSENV